MAYEIFFVVVALILIWYVWRYKVSWMTIFILFAAYGGTSYYFMSGESAEDLAKKQLQAGQNPATAIDVVR